MSNTTIFDKLKKNTIPNNDNAVLNDHEAELWRESLPKKVGMVHLPGVNDEQYQAYIDKVNAKKKESNNLWLQLP